MQSCDWNTIPSSILPTITPMQHLVWSLRSQARNGGNRLCTTGKATMKAMHQQKLTAFI
jgi:hypothetical protein